MRTRYAKAASILSFVIGAMAVGAGGSVLFGRDPGYYVIGWLPIYNFLAGLASMTGVAVLIWRQHRFALPAAVATLGLHGAVMLLLLVFYRDVVAADSLVAMSVRIVVWLVILALLTGKRRSRQDAQLAL